MNAHLSIVYMDVMMSAGGDYGWWDSLCAWRSLPSYEKLWSELMFLILACLLCDLLWSPPCRDIHGRAKNGWDDMEMVVQCWEWLRWHGMVVQWWELKLRSFRLCKAKEKRTSFVMSTKCLIERKYLLITDISSCAVVTYVATHVTYHHVRSEIGTKNYITVAPSW